MRSDSEQEQATAATNLQNTPGFESKNAFNGIIDPLTHFLSRNGFSCVAAIPADQVKGRISNFTAVHFVVKLTPLRNMLRAPILIQELSRTRLEFRNQVRNQTFV